MATMNVNLDDTQEVGEMSGGLLPPGLYTAMATEATEGPNKKGTGRIASYTFEVLDGPNKGRKFFGGFNHQHENPQTQNIGKGQLKRFASAVGVTGVLTDPNMLVRKPFIAKLKVKEAQGEWKAKNEVADYLPLDLSSPLAKEKNENIAAGVTDDDMPAWAK